MRERATIIATWDRVSLTPHQIYTQGNYLRALPYPILPSVIGGLEYTEKSPDNVVIFSVVRGLYDGEVAYKTYGEYMGNHVQVHGPAD